MRKLFEATQKWFTIHGVNGEYSNSKDSKVYSDTHLLFTKKLVLPFSGFTIFTILIESLPATPTKTSRVGKSVRAWSGIRLTSGEVDEVDALIPIEKNKKVLKNINRKTASTTSTLPQVTPDT